MNAYQVLERYNTGERNFRRLNLSGQSFKNQNLSEADFSYSNIHGTDFSGANLSNCKFIGVNAGIQFYRKIILILITVSIAAISIILCYISATDISIGLWITPKIMSAMFLNSNLPHTDGFFKNVQLIWVIRGFLAFIVIAIYFTITFLKGLRLALEAYISTVLSLIILGGLMGILIFTIYGALTLDIRTVINNIGYGLFFGTLPGFLAGFVLAGGSVLGSLLIGITIFLANIEIQTSKYWVIPILLTVLLILHILFLVSIGAKITGIIVSLCISISIVIFGFFLSCKSLSKNLKYDLINKIGIYFSTIGGTSFKNSNLTNIEAWNTESSTNLEEVDCRFVYLLERPKRDDDRERRPSFGEFASGEFTKLFQKVLHTVDLVFGDGIDWEAFIKAFKNVKIENENTELSIQSIENKGNGVFVIRVSVPFNTDKEKIHGDFTRNYELALKAVEEKYKLMLKSVEDNYQIKLENQEEIIRNFR